MNIALINPPLVDAPENLGSATTIPLGITYLAGYLRDKGVNVSIIDAFGENPLQINKFKERKDPIQERKDRDLFMYL